MLLTIELAVFVCYWNFLLYQPHLNSDKSIDIYDVYKITTKSETVVKMYGTWNQDNGINVIDSDIWSRRGSLEGQHIR